jgi:hypothetical protein
MTSWLAALASAVVIAQGSAPPAKADFSGTWRMDPERSESTKQGYPVEPVLIVIQQTDTEVTIEASGTGARTRTVYRFIKSPPTTLGIEGAPEGRAYWRDAALVTEGTRLVQGQTVATRETRTLNADGTEMTVDAIVMVQHGYEFRGARNYGAGRDVYVRVSR